MVFTTANFGGFSNFCRYYTRSQAGKSTGYRPTLKPLLYKLYVFCSDMKFKMAATAGLSLTLDPMGKMFQNASSLKPLGQLKPNFPGMIIGRSSTKFMFFMPIGNPRWLPPQVIVLTQDHIGKIQKYILL